MPAFYYIPKAALAAVIICAVAHMVDYRIVIKMWRISSECQLSSYLTCTVYVLISLKSSVFHRVGPGAFYSDIPDEFLAGAVRHHRRCSCIWSPAAVQHCQAPDKGTVLRSTVCERLTVEEDPVKQRTL